MIRQSLILAAILYLDGAQLALGVWMLRDVLAGWRGKRPKRMTISESVDAVRDMALFAFCWPTNLFEFCVSRAPRELGEE